MADACGLASGTSAFTVVIDGVEDEVGKPSQLDVSFLFPLPGKSINTYRCEKKRLASRKYPLYIRMNAHHM